MAHDVPGLLLLVFLLGVKHGVDPDHLATVDGLTRFNLAARPVLARWSGCLFSLGHGLMVMAVAALVALSAGAWSAPSWLEPVGAWISIAFLVALGALNLAAVLRTPADRVARAAGLKGRWIARLTETSHPVLIASIGAAFALSFDTVSQAALFSLSASGNAGWAFAAFLGFVFTSGMIVADGANGLWVSRLLARADRRARVASRVLGLSIAFLSLAIAALGIAKAASPRAAALAEAGGPALGLGVVLIVLASYALALRLSQEG
ncbi:MAG TPA: nickel transporter [Burkholderiales bacterium]|nr:nickel transporter [Burkholderiales bacterium]